MITALHKFIKNFLELPEEDIHAFEKILTHKTISKKELFVRNGQICEKALFFDHGYFRFFHIDDRGNEVTSDFYFAPSFISSYTSFITGAPSFVNVQAMADMEVLEFTKEGLSKLYEEHPGIERLGRLIAESIAINSEKHLFLLLNQTAGMRYRDLLEKSPEYVKSIPLQYIASYLGISQETLSRMRKTIR